MSKPPKPSRRGFLAAGAAGIASGDIPAAPAGRPNLVLILADDLGWTDVGYQGRRYDTPNIDRFAQQGMVFTRAYSACPTCSPTRASILTGQHPARLRLVRHIPAGRAFGFDRFGRTNEPFHLLPTDPAQFPSRNWLPLEATTIAKALKPLGYHSAFAGKWHLGHEPYHPVRHGFDEQSGVTNYGHPGSYYPPYWPVKEADPYAGAPAEKYLDDRVADDAIAYLERRGAGGPFLLAVFFYGVHSPHIGRKDLVPKYEQRGYRGAQAQYGAMVEAMDSAAGRILSALDRLGLARNTVVVFVSDQGGAFPQAPLRGGKTGGTALYEGGARVPLAVRWPGKVKPGSRTETRVISNDFFPTFVELAGGDPRAHRPLDGRSLVPELTGRASSPPRPLILYRHYEDLYAAVLDGDWKLIASLKGDHELYRLADDPGEANNVAAKFPARREELLAVLARWKTSLGLKP